MKQQSITQAQRLWLVAVCLLAVAVRLPFTMHGGFDDAYFRSWGQKILDGGIAAIYQPPNIPNYPPLYLYLLTPLSYLSQYLFHAAPATAPFFITIQKTANVLVDLVNGLLILAVLRRTLSFRNSLLLACLYLFNPYVIYDSAVWGQVDGLISTAGLSTLYFLDRDDLYGSYLSLGLAMLLKVQSIVFLPLVLVYALRRYGWRRQLLPLTAAVAVSLVLILPFLLNGSAGGMVSQAYVGSASYFPYLSLNAHNVWWLFSDPSNIFAARDTVPLFLGLTAKQVGLLLFSLSYLPLAFTLLRRRRPELGVLALSCGAAYLAFYCLNTEMHERYLYPFFAFWLVGLGLARARAYLGVFAVLSLTQLLSLALMIAAVPSLWLLRDRYYPAITYPLSYANLLCLAAVLAWSLRAYREARLSAEPATP